MHNDPCPKCEAIFAYIVQYKRQHDGNSPTNRRIADNCGISSTSVVHYHLNKLGEAGRLCWHGGGIEVVGGHWFYSEWEALPDHERRRLLEGNWDDDEMSI